jgi:hypothetical protein
MRFPLDPVAPIPPAAPQGVSLKCACGSSLFVAAEQVHFAELAQLREEANLVEAACYRVAQSNSPQALGTPDPDLAKYVIQDEDGDPIIEVDTAAELILALNDAWGRVCDKYEKIEFELTRLRLIRSEAAELVQSLGKPSVVAHLVDDDVENTGKRLRELIANEVALGWRQA